MPLTDNQLIARTVLDGDRHAFSQLVRAHQSSVRGLLRSLVGGDVALADDLAQETFLRAWQGLRRFQGASQFSTWLYRIAWNAFLSDARCKRHRLSAPEHETPPSEDYAASAAIDAVVTRADVERAMHHLRPEERAAIALTFGQELTHEEAAEVLACPLGTLKTHVLRGKTRLKEYLRHEGARLS